MHSIAILNCLGLQENSSYHNHHNKIERWNIKTILLSRWYSACWKQKTCSIHFGQRKLRRHYTSWITIIWKLLMEWLLNRLTLVKSHLYPISKYLNVNVLYMFLMIVWWSLIIRAESVCSCNIVKSQWHIKSLIKRLWR